MEYVSVDKPGLMTTVQDLGRPEYRKYGVSVSGAMDSLSLRLGNILVGNKENAAALEATLIGPTLRFHSSVAFALTGGDLSPKLNGESIPMWTVIQATEGDELSFGKCEQGCRTYIAFAGGIDVPEVMGSKSTFIRGNYGGLEGRALKRGDQILIGTPAIDTKLLSGRRLRSFDLPDFKTEKPIRFIEGPHMAEFTEESVETFLSSTYTVSNTSDRMGYRLDGELLKHKRKADIISDYITMGTIQIPGSGQPIIHMADCGTSGGYTKMGVICSYDLPYVAQKKPGDIMTFQVISVKESQAERNNLEKLIHELKVNNRILELKK